MGWPASSIHLVATSLGPGSFTGLRIGITAAKTFAYAAACDVLAVNTLEVIASQARYDGEIVALLDAQRRQLFAATFGRSDDILTCRTETGVVTVAECLASLTPDRLLIGSGLKHLTEFLSDHPLVADRSIWAPRADTLGSVAAAKYAEGIRHDAWSLNPEYFRRSAAEEKANVEGLDKSNRR
jgi:tRNA threonylcarbamoyladenosine biosynthesis protein TsaB